MHGVAKLFQSLTGSFGANESNAHWTPVATNDAAAATRKRAVDEEPSSPALTSRDARPAHHSIAPATTSGSRRGPRISEDEKRLCGDFDVPADAVYFPSPSTWANGSESATMKKHKPGGDYSLKPVNTLNDAGPFQASRKNTQTYGKHTNHSPALMASSVAFLGEQRTPGRIRGYSAFPDERPSPSKRRKTEHASSPQEIITLDDDDRISDVHRTTASRGLSSTDMARPVSSKSQRSFGSMSNSQSRRDSGPRSSFQATNDFVGPHRKKSRRPTTSASAHQHHTLEMEPHSPQRRHGSDPSQAIEVVDDEPPRWPAADQRSPYRAQQKRAQDPSQDIASDDELQVGNSAMITSRHFPPESHGLSRINHSILSRRVPNADTEHMNSILSSNLRERFSRAEDADAIQDGDELAHDTPSQSMNPRGNYSTKRPYAANIAARRNGHGISLPGWPLLYARSYDLNEGHREMTLDYDKITKVFRILAPSEMGGLPKTLCGIDMNVVNHATADNSSRIRLKGPRSTNSVYWFDLQFAKTEDFKVFCGSVASACGKIHLQSEDHMGDMFAKPLQRNEKLTSLVAVPDNEHTLIEARTQNGLHSKGQRPPRRGLRVIDKLSANGTSGLAIQDSLVVPRATRNEGASVGTSRPMRATRSTRTSYAEDLDKEEISTAEPEPIKFSVVEGLGQKWSKPVSYGSGRQRALVNFDDLVRLDEGEFLNDALIDFYMIYLFEQANIPANRVYFFNTHFYTTLSRSMPGEKSAINYPGVARWTAKADIFNHDYIVVPVCESTHWYLAIICNVANIARKPILDGCDQSSPAVEIQPEATTKVPANGQSVEPVDALPLATPSTSTDQPTAPTHPDPKLFQEEQRNLQEATTETIHQDEKQLAATGRDGKRESPAAVETTRMGKLSLDDHIPKGIIGDETSSPPSTKKTGKRKTRPPMKKFDADEPIILILDSLGLSHPKTVKALKEYVLEEGRAKRGMEASIKQNGFYVRDAHIPMQPNYTDCGVYLLGYVQKFCEDPRKFVTRILSREMDRETDWPDMEAPRIRDAMRRILMELGKQQESERKGKKGKRPQPVRTEHTGEPSKPQLRSPFEPVLRPGPDSRPLAGANAADVQDSRFKSPRKNSPRVVIEIRSPKRSLDSLLPEAGSKAEVAGLQDGENEDDTTVPESPPAIEENDDILPL